MMAEMEALRKEVSRLASLIEEMAERQQSKTRAKERKPAPASSESELRTLRAWRMYTTFAERKHKLEELPEKEVVEGILEPVANQYRMQILKLLLAQSRTFSEISGITGMKGGNLLFHLQKLAEAKMISQRHERGDYLLTDKGLNVLETLSDLFEESRPGSIP
jgi:DNA-binding HxlR family transcriptional regulator